MTLLSIDPASGETIARYEEMDLPALGAVVDEVVAAQRRWADSAFDERTACLHALAHALEAGREELALLMAREMGKPLPQGRAEVDKCALLARHDAEHGPALLADVEIPTDASRSYLCFRPLGVVLAIMPWNFPLWQVLRFAVPGLLAGNGAVLKHASNVTGCALAIEALFEAAGFPRGLLRAVRVSGARAGSLLDHPGVAAATLTGSTPAGREVAAHAGRMLKKVVLELGGNDPYVVLEDADLELAAQACTTGRLLNAGQSCIAAKRWIVVDAVRDAFTERVLERMSAVRMGHPCAEGVEVGPMARVDLRDELHAQVQASVDAGARLALGGAVPDGKGAYYPPTLLTDVGPGMPAFHEELFGPAAAICPVPDERAALAAAADTPFGLGAAVFTRDTERGRRIAERELFAGSCFVNAHVRSDPALPFGGIKDSGFGRELGPLGIKEFVNAKTIWVA